MNELPSQKLRGGFYTPDSVVDDCLQRVASLLNGTRNIRLLEPSAGDGAFVRGLGRLQRDSRLRDGHITCVELVDEEADACRTTLQHSSLNGEVVTGSFFDWVRSQRGAFNALVGNPPFIRYQFVPDADRQLAEFLLAMRGHELHGVSNYWIPFVLLGLDLLLPGGAFSIVLPSELLSTLSGGQVRAEVIRWFGSLRVDLYPRRTFPDILQDVLVLSGVRDSHRARKRCITFCEHASSGAREWQHEVEASGDSWTRYLLSSTEWDCFSTARQLPAFHSLKELATMSVAIVTGANDFFTVDDATLRQYNLGEWARPLLGRTADSPGIIFTQHDHTAAREQGKKGWLLDFSADKPEPKLCPHAAAYLRTGHAMELPKRYKCRIREPWYRVPHVQHGTLMMAKRSHQHHRLILNQAGVFTTDTIYRGEMTEGFRDRESDLVAGFHNSVTVLSAEIEGRTYGGGVLELIPSEIARLAVPMVPMRNGIWTLDGISRRTGGQRDSDDALIDATDDMLAAHVPGLAVLLPILREARNRLRDRRFFGVTQGAQTGECC